MVSHMIKGQLDREAQDEGTGCPWESGRANSLRERERRVNRLLIR
jgi:hypothetical protein